MKGLNDGICTNDAGVDIAQIFEVSMTEWGKKGFERESSFILIYKAFGALLTKMHSWFWFFCDSQDKILLCREMKVGWE